MLDAAIKEQLRTIFAALEANYTFDITVSPQHESRTELLELLNDVASCSEKLSCRINEGKGLEFTLLKGEHRTGITFRAVPNGHEFSSLLLAILNTDGKGKNFPDEQKRFRKTGHFPFFLLFVFWHSFTLRVRSAVSAALDLL